MTRNLCGLLASRIGRSYEMTTEPWICSDGVTNPKLLACFASLIANSSSLSKVKSSPAKVHSTIAEVREADLAFFADKHGDPIKHRYGDVIDWQGTARSVAHIPPYILAFDSNFVEVRHANTGKLVQIIKGSEVSCTNDGQGFGPDTDYGLDKSVEVTLRHVDERGSDSYVVAELVPAA